MTRRPPPSMSRRERQIMDVVYRLGRATAAEIHHELPDAPTYTTVRGLLRVLESKGHLRHEQEERRYVYAASTPRASAGASTLSHVVRTFFQGSPTDAMAALLGSQDQLSDAELARLEDLVKQARRKRGG